MTSEKAEHVNGIVLQPLWKTQKIDWTVRKNVFRKSATNYTLSLADDRGLKGRQAYSFPSDHLKETAYIFQKELTDGNREKQPTKPMLYRPPFHRRRRTVDQPLNRTSPPE